MTAPQCVLLFSVNNNDIGLTTALFFPGLYLPADTVINEIEQDALKPATPLESPPFYFAVVYQDTPIFYGDFKRRIGAQNV